MTATNSANPAGHHRYLSDDDEHERYTSVGIDGLLAASEKLLAVNRGLAEPDDRDALPNDRIHTVDRLMAERIKLDHGKTLRSMMGRVSRTRNLSPMGAASFDAYTTGYLTGNPLVTALEEINPMHILEQKRRITKMGPGGIGDPNAITEQMQAVSGAQFGFIDPISGPESLARDTFVISDLGEIPADEVTSASWLACVVDGQLKFRQPLKLHTYHYVGEMIGAKTSAVDFLVTPNHRLWHQKSTGDTAWAMAFAENLYSTEINVSTNFHQHREGAESIPRAAWYRQPYDDLVFCVTMPGGMIFTRRGSGIGHWTGNSERAGIDVRLATGARIGSDGKIYQLLRNRKTGKNQWVSPTDLVGKTLKLPD